MGKIKSPKQMERHLKGVANHYRIAVMLAIAGSNSLTLEQIVERIGANEKTIGEHTRRLLQAGLIQKKYRGRYVEHSLSPYGKLVAQFIKSFQHFS